MSGKKEPTSVAVTTDDLLRMRDVAAILGCSVAQTYRLANAGLIPVLRVRSMVRVPRAMLMGWIIKNSTGALPPEPQGK